jgi:formate dehydrogenase major subunit
VFLPACSAFEKDGTFMNAERRVQRVRRAIPPVGDTRADWEIVCAVADAMGHGAQFDYDGPDQIWEEVRKVWQVGAGISYARMEQPGGLQWPCPAEGHPGTRMLHAEQFGTRGPRTALRPIAYQPSPERADADYPFVLITGRVLERFNAGTMTGRSLTHDLAPEDLLEMAPEDAHRLGVHDGEIVSIASRHGATRLATRVTDRVGAGQLFASFSDAAAAVNRLTSPYRDASTNTPEYKLTAVRVEKLARA